MKKASRAIVYMIHCIKFLTYWEVMGGVFASHKLNMLLIMDELIDLTVFIEYSNPSRLWR